jgi:DNA repair protein RecN (Recombination protein N)
MLRQLTVRDFAQVKSLDIELHDGLTVITGESGAGKSILFGALALVLGARADNTTIRPGAERTDVSAEFDLSENPAALRFLEEHELSDPELAGRCLLRRTVARGGRSRAYVNGTPVNLKTLETLSAGLIDIHGQNEHQSLLRRAVQLTLLDDFADAAELALEVARTFRAWRDAAAELARLQQTLTESSDRRELLIYQIGELDELALADDEYQTIDARHHRLAQAEALQQRIAATLEGLTNEESGARTALGGAAANVRDIDDEDPALDAARELLSVALDQLDDSIVELRHYYESLNSDPEELATLDARLERISDLARKHRVQEQDLASHHRRLSDELGALAVDADSVATLGVEVESLASEYRGRAAKLSKARRSAAAEFESRISTHMEQLGIKAGALQLEFTADEGESGLERVEYLIITNPNYPAAPLTKIASGGERSRISLAIQIVAANRSRIPSLVLDEADVGIGGTTADTVGRLLRQLADHTQILCVTHAPQVAALGQHHLSVAKGAGHDTEIVHLDRERRVTELARMLGGQEVTAKTIEYARELISAGGS